MTYGVTDTGFSRKTYEVLLAEKKASLRRDIDPRLVLTSDTPDGAILETTSGQDAELWELAEEAYYAFDRANATALQVVALAALTGTARRPQTQGSVIATVNLDGGITFTAGQLVANEDGNTDNRWYNLNEITTTGATADYSITFVSEAYGPNATVATGLLTVIAETATGWNSITNATDATAGSATETIEELRQRSGDELAASGSANLDAILTEVESVTGVLLVSGLENSEDYTVGTLPPHSFTAVVWDGSAAAAANNDIAQAIQDKRPVGIKAQGFLSGNATTRSGTIVANAFNRATEKVVEVNCVVDSASGVAIADVRKAILRVFGTIDAAVENAYRAIGSDVTFIPLQASPFDVDGVDDITTFQIRFTGDSWGSVNLTVADISEIATLEDTNITVTGDVS